MGIMFNDAHVGAILRRHYFFSNSSIKIHCFPVDGLTSRHFKYIEGQGFGNTIRNILLFRSGVNAPCPCRTAVTYWYAHSYKVFHKALLFRC